MAPIVYAHTGNSTARLFILRGLFVPGKKNLIITDNDRDLALFRGYAEQIWNTSPIELTNTSDIMLMQEAKEGIFFGHPDIFRTTGNMTEIRRKSTLLIERSTSLSTESLIEMLLANAYEHDTSLSAPRTYYRNGGVLHIRAQDDDLVYHIEWFDDEIDSIIVRDIRSDSHHFVNHLLLPKKIASPETETLLAFHSELIELTHTMLDGGKSFLVGCDFVPDVAELMPIIDIHLSEIVRPGSQSCAVTIPDVTEMSALVSLLRTADCPVRMVTRFDRSVKEFLSLQSLESLPVEATNERGLESFLLPDRADPLLFITDDVLGKIFVKNRSRSGSIAKNLDLLIALQPGDLVVHRDHGIGRFVAIIKKILGQIEREYLEIHYAEGDKLFVPITEVFRVSKYLGDPQVELTRLSGKEWEKTIEKTNEELQRIAQDILATNAKRQLVSGHAFPSFPEQEALFREQFPYEYTNDQMQAIMDVYRDMEAPTPMDRLLSGDVGFGKTEVAMNAAYKAVLSGVQVAVISPLVVLALEHSETFVERMQSFGVRIELLTRMNTAKEATQILKKMQEGTVDIVIGTHRLLSEDVRWRRLGLLIVDEEHKFGVMHKESIKKMRAGIDILSLSATPIPRSLNLALSGVRQISILATPPKKKRPIETIISAWHDTVIRDAIVHEIERGGQVIVIHNRITGLESIAREIALVMEVSVYPHPSIVTTHGRMHGDDIEDRIHAFKKREYDILLTTTIIENGVNFLSANTIIILDPEDFGLASLHQLRGRVGRKAEQGFCYLIYRKSILSLDEKERLITIANNNHLGAGFEIAMRDMEIRGAGDILGIAQSGHTKAVGLPLYFRMLEEKISEIRSERHKTLVTRIDLDVRYRIPDDFFLSELDKLNFYRELENIETIEDLQVLEDTMNTSSEGLSEVHGLFILMRARLIFGAYQVERISKNGKYYVFDFPHDMTVERMKVFLDRFDREKRMILVSLQKLRIETRYFRDVTDFLHKIGEK